LRERLQSRGIRPDAEEAAVATLAEAGFVDDARLARGRALALAERGWGDAAIEARLEDEGLAQPEVEAAIAELDPEVRRAARAIRGLAPRKAWSLLQRRGFDPETIDSALGALDGGAGEGLG
jgi:SOS response regulatory protein OraA/RecX